MITVLHLITSLTRGGAEQNLVRLIAGMDASRFRHVVISMLPPMAFWNDLARLGIELHTLNMRRGLPGCAALLKFRRLVRQIQPDILQTWLYHADLLGTIAVSSPKLVWNVRNSDMISGKRLSHKFIVKLLGRLSWKPAAVVVNSSAGLQAHLGQGYKPRRWELIRNGYDFDFFRPSKDARHKFRTKLGLPSAGLVIGMIARFDPMKDHENLLRACQTIAIRLGTFRILFAGIGMRADNHKLMKDIERYGLSEFVVFLEEYPNMPELYSGLDIVVHPSAYGEGFPNVVAEAMACGVPVVATNVGDARILLERAGCLVPPRNSNALAAALLSLANMSSHERHEFGDAGRAHVVQNFGIDHMVRGYASLYDSLITRRLRHTLPRE